MDESLWKDPTTGTIVLNEQPRPVLGYLPKRALIALEELVRTPYQNEVARLRELITTNQAKMRASIPDEDEVKNVLGESDSYLMASIVTHREISDHWANLQEQKTPAITLLTEREEFLQECEEFEIKASGNEDRLKAKGSSLAIQAENKFRAYGFKKINSDDSDAIRACRQYMEDTGRLFEIDGVDYLEMIREQKFGRPTGKDTLKKIDFDRISLKAKQIFSGAKVVSNLVPDHARDTPPVLRVSMYEKGLSTNDWITNGKHDTSDPIIAHMEENGRYNNSINPAL